jgi:hypothetical protein
LTAALAIRLPVLPEDITSRADRFRCTPYRAVVTADCCVKRRALYRAGIKRVDYLNCFEACPIGEVVERNSGGPIKVAARLAAEESSTGKHLKLIQAVRYGDVFEDVPRRPRKGKAKVDVEARRQQWREAYHRKKLRQAAQKTEAS